MNILLKSDFIKDAFENFGKFEIFEKIPGVTSSVDDLKIKLLCFYEKEKLVKLSLVSRINFISNQLFGIEPEDKDSKDRVDIGKVEAGIVSLQKYYEEEKSIKDFNVPRFVSFLRSSDLEVKKLLVCAGLGSEEVLDSESLRSLLQKIKESKENKVNLLVDDLVEFLVGRMSFSNNEVGMIKSIERMRKNKEIISEESIKAIIIEIFKI